MTQDDYNNRLAADSLRRANERIDRAEWTGRELDPLGRDTGYLPPEQLTASERALYEHGMAHARKLVDGLPAYCRNEQAGARRDLVRAACQSRPQDYEEYYNEYETGYTLGKFVHRHGFFLLILGLSVVAGWAFAQIVIGGK